MYSGNDSKPETEVPQCSLYVWGWKGYWLDCRDWDCLFKFGDSKKICRAF